MPRPTRPSATPIGTCAALGTQSPSPESRRVWHPRPQLPLTRIQLSTSQRALREASVHRRLTAEMGQETEFWLLSLRISLRR
jgi:hypothetical protein